MFSFPRRVLPGLLGVLFAACTGASPGPDASTDSAADGATDAQGACRVDSDCSDNVFCNGVERCVPGQPGADARGCAPALSSPCPSGLVCSESARACALGDAGSEAGPNCDGDGDGVQGPQCGGMDCDDNDPDRFPGNRERCSGTPLRSGMSPAGHDEDCNPCTVNDPLSTGDGDTDNDGFPAASCANPWLGAAAPTGCNGNQVRSDPTGAHQQQGTDCNDMARSVNPNAPEVCNNMVDDNCNGGVDEDSMVDLFQDSDHDGYGSPGMSMRGSACNPPVGWVRDNTDCDDARAHSYPGAPEQCDRRDNDCSNPGSMAGGVEPSEDQDNDMHAPVGARCLSPADTRGVPQAFPKDDCDDNNNTVFPGATENLDVCDGLDQDCDPSTSELFRTAGCPLGGACISGGRCARATFSVGVATGANHTCGLAADGSVRCWGANGSNQVSPVASSSFTRPVLVSGVSHALQLVAGLNHTCARLDPTQLARATDPNVQCWGANTRGQLGMTSAGTAPVFVPGLSSVVELVAGDEFTCARRSTGAVTCWGAGASGQLGNGTQPMQSVGAVPVSLAASATALFAGGRHACALLTTGAVQCWGDNAVGQVGAPTGLTQSTPLTVPGLGTVRSLGGGEQFSCALRTDGTVACWGQNDAGQLGTGTASPSSVAPVMATAVSNALQLVGGNSFGCLRNSAGGVACWGDNSSGQLGNGSLVSHLAPAPVLSVSGVLALSARLARACAVTNVGALRCWGDGGFGALGDGAQTLRSTPVYAALLAPTVQLGAGESHVCARGADGTVRCWGSNASGELGGGATSPSGAPTLVASLTDVVSVAAGQQFTCAALADGTARCWGRNDVGQLGNGTTMGSSSPQAVLGLVSGVQELCASGSHACARLQNGTVRCWGSNTLGELGDGTTSNRSTPVAVGSLSNATQLACGAGFSCARLSDGTARCWGDGSVGQLGDGTTAGHSAPAAVAGLTGASALFSGYQFACSLQADGTARCWGANSLGELGLGNTMPQLTPTLVPGLSGLRGLAASGHLGCGWLADGTARCWGWNTRGQLGDGTNVSPRTSPTPVRALSRVAGMGLSAVSSCAVLDEGSVECWGDNTSAQLGNAGAGPSSVLPLFPLL